MAENVRSAVADITGIVRVMCRSSHNIILLLSILLNHCRAGSSANNRALLNFEYLDMCVRFGMQSIPGPAHFAFHACNRTCAHASWAGQLKLMSSVHADRETELLATLRETYFPEAQHGEQESPERRYAS